MPWRVSAAPSLFNFKDTNHDYLFPTVDAYTYIDPDLCCSGRRSGPGEPLCCFRVWIEKHPAGSSDYPFRLLGFREPALPNNPKNRLGDSNRAHGSPMLPGPGFPINVGNWNTTGRRSSGSSEKKKNEYKNQKIESLGIEFNTEKGGYYFFFFFSKWYMIP